MENKQTAVEWLFEKLKQINFEYNTSKISPREFIEQKEQILNQAKEMEKQQIIDAITIGFDEGRLYMHNGTTKFETGIEYYNETYGK